MSKAPTHVVEVFVDLEGDAVRVGTARLTSTRGLLKTRFTYEESFLANPLAFELSPDLTLGDANMGGDGLPGALADSAPDHWGRNLIAKKVQADALKEGRGLIEVTDVDYLLGVSDITRQGAIRFRQGSAFLADDADVPLLIELPKLLNAAALVDKEVSGADSYAAIKELLDAGTGSLGGARPKASVREGATLSIAKFPHHGDQWDVEAWEATMLDLASSAGITVPNYSLVDVDGKKVLLTERFDRDGETRLPYVSAMTMVGAKDRAVHDYSEVAEVITMRSPAVTRDLHELFRRICFSIIVNNTDDHLRNHGFLRRDKGWALAPMFDVNPTPYLTKERATSIGFVTNASNAFEGLFSIAEFFELSNDEAASIWRAVLETTSNWRDLAAANGISKDEIALFMTSMDYHRA